MRKCGRPSKKDNQAILRETIMNVAVAIIEADGYAAVTVRRVCQSAGIATGTFYYHFANKDDLLMEFVKQECFAELPLTVPTAQIAGRIIELYMHLIERYLQLGLRFMKSFYTPDNQALRAYMCRVDGGFAPDTIMARCEKELLTACRAGILRESANAHRLSEDICTVVKGCLFEWCLSDGTTAVREDISRLIGAVLAPYTTDPSHYE